MSDIKAIETFYNGCHFRSRLEARWAVFFDTLEIRWEYEPEGFEIDGGHRYLPDFYLPKFDLWIEIKPGEIPGWWGARKGQINLAQAQACDKASWFANHARKNLLMLCGQPRYSADLDTGDHYAGLMFFGDLESPFFKGTIAEDCMESLSEFLQSKGFDVPDFDGTLRCAWTLIEADNEYYEKAHNQPNLKWAFGITDTHWRWVMVGDKPSIDWSYEELYKPGIQIVEALNAASYARFDQSEKPKSTKDFWTGINDIPF